MLWFLQATLRLQEKKSEDGDIQNYMKNDNNALKTFKILN